MKDPYSKTAYGRRRYGPYRYGTGTKDTYNPAASEFGVFKVRNKDYYIWAVNEKDYENGGKRSMGEVEVDDPLVNLTKEEKKNVLKPICQREKYDEPFKDPKIIDFLKGVYYNFLARSKNLSAPQGGKKNQYSLILPFNFLMLILITANYAFIYIL